MTPTLKVAQVSSVHHPNDNRISFHIASTLAEAGYETTVIAPTTGNSVDMPPSVKLIPLKHREGRLKRFAVRPVEILATVFRNRFNVVHFHDPELLPLGIVFWCLGFWVIYDAHECHREDVEEKYWLPRPIRAIARWAIIFHEWIAARTFAGVVCASAQIHDAIASPRGIIVRNFPRQNDALAAMYARPLAERCYAVGYFGSIDETRCGAEMISALALLRSKHPEAKIVIAGRIAIANEDPDAIASRMANLDIEYHPYLSRPQMLSLLGKCRVALALYRSTKAYENAEFSTKVLECIAVGTPVVAGPHPEPVRRFVLDNKIGLAIRDSDRTTIADAVSHLLSDEELWAECASQAAAISPRYSWESEAQKLLGLYSSIENGVSR